MNIPRSHPRYASLRTRAMLVDAVKKGITSMDGLLAHGRGEAFDYLLGEKTHKFAEKAIRASAALLVLAKHPTISVNGNSAALVTKELVALASLLNAALEVNIFHSSRTREENIKKHLEKYGATQVLLPQKNHIIKYLDSNRKFVNKDGIYIADVVFVPLEDGDRAEALIKNGKKVITIDLNPLSRTGQKSSITIVDNITRALPLLIIEVRRMNREKPGDLVKYLEEYNNSVMLQEALHYIVKLWMKLRK